MSHVIIDRRKNDKAKSTVNRSRYLRRVKDSIKRSVRDLIVDGSLSDSLSNKDKKVKVKKKELSQPEFHHKQIGGIRDKVYPGNDHYVVGDKIQKPSGGSGGSGSDPSDSEEEFAFSITQKEFLDIFFENLYLPDMVKKDLSSIEEYVNKRAGFSVDGNPSRLNIVRSMKQSMARTIALTSEDEEELEKAEKRLDELNLEISNCSDIEALEMIWIPLRQILETRIKELKERIKSVPFLDDIDLRYNRWDKISVPSTQAVVFGLMDVSGSMGSWEKDMGKRFFLLLMLFLQRKYKRIDNVWIIHTTTAAEVSENEFFSTSESGGTAVSSVYQEMHRIQSLKYPISAWNIYAVQISDGDNDSRDIPICISYMKEHILPVCQYFAYVETRKKSLSSMMEALGGYSGKNAYSELYKSYNHGLNDQPNFVLSIITDASDIYPVFRKLFEKKEK